MHVFVCVNTQISYQCYQHGTDTNTEVYAALLKLTQLCEQ